MTILKRSAILVCLVTGSVFLYPRVAQAVPSCITQCSEAGAACTRQAVSNDKACEAACNGDSACISDCKQQLQDQTGDCFDQEDACDTDCQYPTPCTPGEPGC